MSRVIHVGRQALWAVPTDSNHAGRCIDTCPGSDDHQHLFTLKSPDEASDFNADSSNESVGTTIAVNYLISKWLCDHCGQERRIAEPGLS